MTDPTYPEPLRLLPDLEVAAPFPLNALGEVLGGAAAAIVEAVQVPEALAAQSILTAAALATQSHGNVERDGQLIPLSLFALTIAESGDRKSAADRLALRSHYVHQQALLEACSGLLIPDTDLGENPRHQEVFDEQATTYVFRRVQTRGCCLGSGSRL
ncbi:DUF3987 domain-containing protein [Pseudomonas sp. FeN3W]|nr:DUF3987 domain-containing protein [Pseudomonas sp. FeN3W]